MGNGNHDDMSWRDFEKEVENWIDVSISGEDYRIENQRSSEYEDGEIKRMDIHIAERRQGGNHHVIDAKHFHGDLPSKEIKDAYEYKRKSRASTVTVVVSDTTSLPDSTMRVAKNLGVKIVRKRGSGTVNRIKERFDEKPEFF